MEFRFRHAWRRACRQICFATAVALAGCSLAPGSAKIKTAADTVIATGISDRRSYNDKKAETLLTLPCDISIGAYYRLSNTVQQEALTMLCSGKRPNEIAPPLTETVGAP